MTATRAIGLPNGLVCFFTSDAMRTVVKYMRWETFKRGQYRRAGFELRPDDTVLEIGGNIGMFVLWAAPQIKRGRLISVEPTPSALECLKLNIKNNGLMNVSVIEAAAGGHDGTMELVHHGGWEAITYSAAVKPPWFYTGSVVARACRRLVQRAFRHVPDSSPTQRIIARQMTLGRIMDESQLSVVNFLKIDCEGSEFEILRNVNAQHLTRIERVVIEYHDYGRDRDHRELVEILRNNGFEVEVIHTLLETMFAWVLRARFGTIWAKRQLN